ncbi:MAG: hypothetical protein MK108_13390 [Mariniblastus sp.]|nr:hypothetical protein [Mariniblastus sp.]
MHVQTLNKAMPVASLIFCLGLLCGCSGPPKMDEDQAAAGGQLMEVYSCYMQYANQNRRGPDSLEDLQPLLNNAGVDTSNVLVSPGDGSDLVVLWGVTPDVTSGVPVVMGYEANSQGGRRNVMTSMGVWVMSDDEFFAAQFPAGHQAPAR